MHKNLSYLIPTPGSLQATVGIVALKLGHLLICLVCLNKIENENCF